MLYNSIEVTNFSSAFEESVIMRLIDKLERKFGRYAIKGLMTYITALTGVVFLIKMLFPDYILKIMLIPEYVLKGEVWRLITYIFIPEGTNPIFIVFELYFFYMIGASLENEWGSFRFNVYYLLGMIGTTIAAFITGAATAVYINLSLFLAFAYLYPNYEILLFFIIPIKIKYLGWINWLFIAISVIFLPFHYKLASIASVLNFFVFFGKDIFTRTNTSRRAYYNRKRFKAEMPKKYTIHRCAVCGITEKDNPDMQFRYCIECDGDYEYCMEHLNNHKHVKKVIQLADKK